MSIGIGLPMRMVYNINKEEDAWLKCILFSVFQFFSLFCARIFAYT